MPVDLSLHSKEKEQKLHMDVIHKQMWNKNEGRTKLGLALQGQLGLLRLQSFKPGILYVDPHSMFKSMVHNFPEVEVDMGGAGNYVPKVDAKIQSMKELYTTMKSGLAWTLPGSLVKDLVAYVVSRMNIHRYAVFEDTTLK
jgi:hypothetical protein